MEKLILSNETLIKYYPFEAIELNHILFSRFSNRDCERYDTVCKEIIPDIKSEKEINELEKVINFIKNDTENKETIEILNLLIEYKDKVRYITDGSFVAFYVLYNNIKEQFTITTGYNTHYPQVKNDMLENFNRIPNIYNKIKFLINTFGIICLRNYMFGACELSLKYDIFDISKKKYNIFGEVATGKQIYLWCQDNIHSIFDDEKEVASKIIEKYFSNGKHLNKFKKYEVISNNGNIIIYNYKYQEKEVK